MKFLPSAILALGLFAPVHASPRPQVPIMGWSSWNHFRINIDEVMIREQADAMASNGMKEAGYRFINIDDGFFGGRDAEGRLFSYDLKFPSGMKALADYIRAKGLKPGIYSEAGANTCGSIYDSDPRGSGVGLFGHEEQDLQLMLVDWGYDFIKVDWCGGLRQGLSEQEQYTRISRIVRRLKPDAVFNVCRWQYPGDWVKDVADSWRISGDIEPTFESVMRIVDLCEPLWRHSGPGGFNDMDMLQVGRGMTETEDRTHFTMWCMMNSPLLAGNDLRSMTPATLAILTQPELIALNQDSLAYQARRLRDDGDTELWAKPLGSVESGQVAVTLLNRGSQETTVSFNLTEIGIVAAAGYSVRDLWQRQDLDTASTLEGRSITVPAHGVVVLRIAGQAVEDSPLAIPRNLTWDNGMESNNWNTTEQNWSGSVWKNSNPDNAIFGSAGAGPVTLTEGIAVNRITFNAPGYMVFGNTLMIGSVGDTYIMANHDAVIASILSGGLLRKNGPATLTLDGTNSHSGTVIENGGLAVASLADGGPSGIGSSWLAMDNNSTLRYTGTGSEKSSRDLWINNAPGTRTIEITDAGASITLTGGNGTINRPIRKTGGGALVLGKAISGDASVEIDGGTLTLTGVNTYSGNTTIHSGTLKIADGASLYNGGGNTSAVLTVNQGATLELTRWGYGPGAANQSLGGLDYSPARFVINGGTVRYTGGAAGAPTDPNESPYGPGFTIGALGATLDAAKPDDTWTVKHDSRGYGPVASNAGGTLTLTGIGNGIFDKELGGSGGVTKSGSGTWSLAHPNSYTGPTTVLAGTLALGNGTSNTNLADSANVSLAAGAKLHLDFTGTDTVNALSIGGVAKPPGVYSASNSDFLTGTGTLTVLTSQVSDYDTWKSPLNLAGGPDDDDDHDGLSNFEEYSFGLDPKNSGSVRTVIMVALKNSGALTYTRRKTSLTNLSYAVWISTDLNDWTEDTAASQTASSIPGKDNKSVEVLVSPERLGAERLFVRIAARRL